MEDKYKEIVRSNGILDKVSEVTIKESGAKHEGLASLTQCVTVAFENPEKDPLNLFVKVHTQNASHDAMLDDLKAFEKEATFLMKYLTAAQEFCTSKGVTNLMDMYPKCYYGDDKMIVLENLVVKGYQLLSDEVRHDFDIATLALKMLGKHHAISYAMIHENGGDDSFFQRFLHLDHDGYSNPIISKMMGNSFETSLKTNRTIVENNQIDNSQQILTELQGFSGSACLDMVLDSLTCNKEKDGLLVLNHGDFKFNNMMFRKDKETGEILHQMVIDFQITRYNSPGLDLGFYLFTSVMHQVRQNRLQELLEIYRKSLNDTSRELGYPIELSYEDLFLQYRRKFKFGFWITSTMVGPGMAIMKTVDVTKMDVSDWGNIMNKLLMNWIDENPGEGKIMAKEIKDLLDEYNKLSI